MSLREVLTRATSHPFSRPPALHINVVCAKEEERVLKWDFADDKATPVLKKVNMVAIISDGHTLSKVCIFEEFAHKVIVGKNYLIKGYGVRGTSPPFHLMITKETQFFRSSPVTIKESLQAEAAALLNPPSILTKISELREGGGFITIRGRVTECSVMKEVKTKMESVPVKRVKIEEDGKKAEVSLWREAATVSFSLGEKLQISHLKYVTSGYGTCVQSTRETKIEKVTINLAMEGVEVRGVSETTQAGVLQLVLSIEGDFFISNTLWEPFDKLLDEGEVYVDITVSDSVVSKIKNAEKPQDM